jgi:hemerythrin superfamily protein
MSVFDRVIAAVTPPESDEARREAHLRARELAQPGDWLSAVLDHHEQIDAAFDAVKSARDATSRLTAQKQLAELLTAHSMAEEAVLYPALARADEEAHAVKAYTEQAAAKLQLGLLEYLRPMTEEFLDKLEHIRGAVAHHVYEEESKWFLQLKEQTIAGEQDKLAERYREEFARYFGAESGEGNGLVKPVPRRRAKAKTASRNA